MPGETEYPQNIEAEMALLGAILVNNNAYHAIGEIGLLASDFFEPLHGDIWDALAELIEAKKLANPLMLAPRFSDHLQAINMTGAEYLARLAASAITVIDAEDYAATVKDLAFRRAMIDQAATIDALARNTALPTTDLKLMVDAQLSGAMVRYQEQTGALIGSYFGEVVRQAEAAAGTPDGITGVRTGLTDYDALTAGLHADELTIWAGRPGMGKSALALTVARNIARAGGTVGYWSLEMGGYGLAKRLLSAELAISGTALRRGRLDREQWVRLIEKTRELENLPIHLETVPAIDVGRFHAQARALKRKRGLDVIFVDYLQLLRGLTAKGREPENRTQEVTLISQRLKQAAMDLKVPIVALSQLSRAVEQRADKVPHLSDLRESGSIEQDADNVGFLYRHYPYALKEGPSQDNDPQGHADYIAGLEDIKDQAQIGVEKQREDMTGVVRLRFDGPTTTFYGITNRTPDGDRGDLFDGEN